MGGSEIGVDMVHGNVPHSMAMNETIDKPKREYQIVAYLTLPEREELEALARACHRSNSDYLRILILQEIARAREDGEMGDGN